MRQVLWLYFFTKIVYFYYTSNFLKTDFILSRLLPADLEVSIQKDVVIKN